MNNLVVGFGIAVGLIILGAAAVILIAMARGRIDLQFLISEQDGSASISRFQLLIFTFVIALSYFLLVIGEVNRSAAASAQLILPDVPTNVLTLLGISGGSYVLSKGIQKTAEVAAPDTQIGKPPPGQQTAGGSPQATSGAPGNVQQNQTARP